MATDELSTGYKKRRSSLRGSLLSYVRNGTEVHAKWPKKRGAAKTQADQDRRDFFAGVQASYRNLPPQMKVELTNAVKGTPLLPRDLWMSMAAGRFASFLRPDGKVIYSMAQLTDVSTILDIVAQDPGDLLARGPDFWEAIAADVAGKVLTAQGAGVSPAWEDLPPETPFWQQIPGGAADKVLTSLGPAVAPTWRDLPPSPSTAMALIATQTLSAPATLITFSAIPNGFKTLIINGQVRGTDPAAALNQYMFANNDLLANYDVEMLQVTSGGTLQGVNATAAATPYAGLLPAAGSVNANMFGAFEITIPRYASAAFEKSWMVRTFGEATRANTAMWAQHAGVHWRNAAAINRLDFKPSAGQFAAGSVIDVYGIG